MVFLLSCPIDIYSYSHTFKFSTHIHCMFWGLYTQRERKRQESCGVCGRMINLTSYHTRGVCREQWRATQGEARWEGMLENIHSPYHSLLFLGLLGFGKEGRRRKSWPISKETKDLRVVGAKFKGKAEHRQRKQLSFLYDSATDYKHI